MREEGNGCAVATIILLIGIIGMLVLVIFMFREPNFALRDALPHWAKEALFGEGETYETKETKEQYFEIELRRRFGMTITDLEENLGNSTKKKNKSIFY